MAEWFRPGAGATSAVPPSVTALGPLRKAEAAAAAAVCWRAYASSPRAKELAAALPAPVLIRNGMDLGKHRHKLRTGEKTMPFFFLERGATIRCSTA